MAYVIEGVEGDWLVRDISEKSIAKLNALKIEGDWLATDISEN